jgi:pyruvate formate lyase activating enzyme
LESNPDFNVEIFKTHNLAETKYNHLDKQFKSFKQVSDEDMGSVLNRIREINKNARIISL